MINRQQSVPVTPPRGGFEARVAGPWPGNATTSEPWQVAHPAGALRSGQQGRAPGCVRGTDMHIYCTKAATIEFLPYQLKPVVISPRVHSPAPSPRRARNTKAAWPTYPGITWRRSCGHRRKATAFLHCFPTTPPRCSPEQRPTTVLGLVLVSPTPSLPPSRSCLMPACAARHSPASPLPSPCVVGTAFGLTTVMLAGSQCLYRIFPAPMQRETPCAKAMRLWPIERRHCAVYRLNSLWRCAACETCSACTRLGRAIHDSF